MLRSVAAAVSVVCIDGLGARHATANSLKVGHLAPEATLVALDGSRFSSTDLRGRVVILTFWATWCAPCREELPLLSDYGARHAEQGLTVLGFCMDTTDRMTAVVRMAQGLSFPVGLASASSAPGYGRIWRLPVSFTIDRQGMLVEDGWKSPRPAWTVQQLDRVVSPLLRPEG